MIENSIGFGWGGCKKSCSRCFKFEITQFVTDPKAEGDGAQKAGRARGILDEREEMLKDKAEALEQENWLLNKKFRFVCKYRASFGPNE